MYKKGDARSLAPGGSEWGGVTGTVDVSSDAATLQSSDHMESNSNGPQPPPATDRQIGASSQPHLRGLKRDNNKRLPPVFVICGMAANRRRLANRRTAVGG